LHEPKYFNLLAALRSERFEDDLAFRGAYFSIDFDYSWLLASSIICNVLEIATMVIGYPSTTSSFNLAAGWLHLFGAYMTCMMLMKAWRIHVYLLIFVLCSAGPMIASALFAVDLVVLKSSVLRRLDVRI